MKQEQKPFKIKRVFSVNLPSDVAYYITDANAEIQRLQDECAKTQQDFDTACRLLKTQRDQIESLKQQLADAPTWDKWVDATTENLDSASLGVYELELHTGETEIRTKCYYPAGLRWKSTTSESSDDYISYAFTRFRRLNYEPQPAREVEKKYYTECVPGFPEAQKGYILREIAQTHGRAGIIAQQLARDLLAAQARIWELEGK